MIALWGEHMDNSQEEYLQILKKIMKERNVSQMEAALIFWRGDREDIDEEEMEYEAAVKGLLAKQGPKAIMVHIDRWTPKDKAFAIIHSKIKVKCHHILREISFGKISRTIVACEFDITKEQAEMIVESLNGDAYSDKEVEAIVTEHVPFDIRIKF
jgi:hypothetical protein